MRLSVTTLAVLTALLSQATSTPTSGLTTRQTKPRELIQPDLYPLLQRYTRFAAAAQGAFYYHDKDCPSPPFKSSLIKRVESNTNAAEIYIFTDSTAKELILSFASLTPIHDPSTDSTFSFAPLTTSPGCTGCQVHAGVLTLWRSLQDNLTKTLAELTPTLPGYKTILVGHSIAGSVASLAYTELKATGTIPVEKAYTMGALRVGNEAYADFTDRLAGASDTQLGDLIRITHGVDSLPNLPSKPLGFQHTRTEIYQVDTQRDSGEQSAQTTFRCFGQEAADCIRGNAAAVGNYDHSKYTGVLMVDEVECNHWR